MRQSTHLVAKGTMYCLGSLKILISYNIYSCGTFPSTAMSNNRGGPGVKSISFAGTIKCSKGMRSCLLRYSVFSSYKCEEPLFLSSALCQGDVHACAHVCVCLPYSYLFFPSKKTPHLVFSFSWCSGNEEPVFPLR